MTAKPAFRGAEAIISLSAVDQRDRIASGALRAEEVTEAYIARINATEPDIHAWAWFDPDHARAQARSLDAYRGTGRPIGPLHGVPVGLKDIIDAVKIPTANGTSLDEGRMPEHDSFVAAKLKAAGAVIMGKTAITELAYLHPGPTRNPVNPEHTPGGSSSGSAAAVAAGQVPLSIGTQTGGSLIRPAAFCGTVGFKPTFGAIPRTGILAQSPSLDTVGVFARTVRDVALIADVIFGHDQNDRATSLAPAPRLLETASTSPPLPPVFAFVKPPNWEMATQETQDALAEIAEFLGQQCFEVDLPVAFDGARAAHGRIYLAEMAKCYHTYERRGRDLLSEELRTAIDAGKAIPARDYIAALDWPDVLYAGLSEVFNRCDVILTAAAPGPAPLGIESTGDAVFNSLWTLLGVPAVTLPVLQVDGLPMGVQLVGRRGDDGRLLRAALWLMERVAATEGEAS
ncbi:amidase [Ancylobacter pratisalsi]|uniref:Amidase n=1 Tax=Ancylobacter pratisalsi TaxID=1745854 RepID=A0A6P1YQX1_9HYPH|nr:amidase [Ancylobacter pratisalsi]QIB35532.1 amidase [Ancylobacter pratisalsi]